MCGIFHLRFFIGYHVTGELKTFGQFYVQIQIMSGSDNLRPDFPLISKAVGVAVLRSPQNGMNTQAVVAVDAIGRKNTIYFQGVDFMVVIIS